MMKDLRKTEHKYEIFLPKQINVDLQHFGIGTSRFYRKFINPGLKTYDWTIQDCG